MKSTKETTTWLGTSREQRGRWHGIPYVIRTYNTHGITGAGWVLLTLAALLIIVITLLQEFVF